jgi:hypothetical protein
MNTLLASSPTLTLRTYTLCTALALPKLLVHCALGTSIKNFAAYNGAGHKQQLTYGVDDVGSNFNGTSGAMPMFGNDVLDDDASSSHTAETIKHVFGFGGVALCIGIFIYLFRVASKAVDEELEGEEDGMGEEYDIMLSEDEEDQDDDFSDLDDDDLNITRGSSESALDGAGSSPTQQASLLVSSTSLLSIPSPKVVKDRFSGSESSLVDGTARPYEKDSSELQRNFGDESLYSVSSHYTDYNPYPSHTFPNGNRTSRLYESQVSLADSIVELEKHAVEMEKEPLFN